jgi:branched-subunit amino acid aminotransferase/4-amino-4-deoxychorismate lyase
VFSQQKFWTDYGFRADALKKSNQPFAKGIAYVEGQYVPLHEARIPLLDQGFLHSDLTYDVPAVWDGRFFRLDEHIDRLEESCMKMRLRNPFTKTELRQKLIEMVAKSGIRDAYVEVIVTRGLHFLREVQAGEAKNSVYLLAMPYVWIMPQELQAAGGSAVVTRTVRRIPPGAIDPTIKNLQWGDFIRGLLEAGDRKAIYPILPDGDGNLTEGSGYNIFVVKNGILRTPRRGVLEGVTRRTVLEIAASMGWMTEVTELPVSAVYDCDELFFTSTAGGVMPITTVDGQSIGSGEIGPITRQVWEAYWQAHYDPKLSFAISYN